MSKVRYKAQEKRYRQKKKSHVFCWRQALSRLFFFPEESLERGSLDRGSFVRSSVIAVAENGAHCVSNGDSTSETRLMHLPF